VYLVPSNALRQVKTRAGVNLFPIVRATEIEAAGIGEARRNHRVFRCPRVTHLKAVEAAAKSVSESRWLVIN